MTSRLQQPSNAGEQAPRRFVAFPFRLHAHTQANGSRDVRRLDRQVMRKGEDERLDGVNSAGSAVGFVHLGRSRLVRCEISFDDAGSNDTQQMRTAFAGACVTQITEDA